MLLEVLAVQEVVLRPLAQVLAKVAPRFSHSPTLMLLGIGEGGGVGEFHQPCRVFALDGSLRV